MTFQTLSLTQGTPEWHAHRAQHFNASDAPAMMACSPYKSRADLIKELATGLMAEVSPQTQRRFDDGHRYEALARPLAEEFIGQELFPVVGTNGKFSASFDGITLMEDIAFEHKSLNNDLRDAMHEGCTGTDLPLVYQVQMEHQIMVADTVEKVLFMASKWDGDALIEERHCWYYPNLELRAQIIAGWEQLEKDVAAYVPQAAQAKPLHEAKLRDALPVLRIDARGEITASNLDDFKEVALERINSINTVLETDQQFADADADAKWLRDVSSAMKQAGKQVRANMQSVDAVLNVLEQLDEIATKKAIDLEKRVKSEKDVRKQLIIQDAQQDLDAHVAALNQRLGANWLPRIAGGFAETIKGLKSLDSMRDKVAVALTNAKLQAKTTANTLLLNRDFLRGDGTGQDWITLFPDFATVGTKAAEDFQALAALRIERQKAAEAARLDAERERIRAEEAARLEREAAAKAQQEAELERLRIQQQAQQEQAEIALAQQTGTLAAPVAQDLAGLVQDKAVEDVAGIDAQQAIAAAKAGTAVADSGETLTLGQINTMIAPLKIDAAGLAELGFTPCSTVKAAKHYRCSSLPAICRALIDRLDSVLATV